MTVDTAARAFLASSPENLINGVRRAAADGRRFEVDDPFSGTTLATVPRSSAVDVDEAVRAARAALPGWSSMSPATRARLLWTLADLIESHADELARLDVLDNGKTLADALAVDIPLTIEIFRYYAGWVSKIEGRQIPVSIPNFHVYTRRQPIGVVGAIVPWNFPLLMCAYKLGPALAAGCTVVLKPAEQTPLSALRLADLIVEAGLPPGVVNILTGFGEEAGAAIAAHDGVDKVSFTGDYQTGRKILEASRGNLKRVTLELGGKSPNLVFPDADLDHAVEGAFGAVFFNQGQCCIAGARLFVHDDVADSLVERLVDKANSVRLGSGLDAATQMGPLVSDTQRRRVISYIESALESGGELLAGGPTPPPLDTGHFVRPTVLSGLAADSPIMQEEVFGPVLAVTRFRTDDEVIALANGVRFGLAAGVWTRDLGRAHRVSAALDAGTVWVNTYGMFDVAAPYGGFKMSGYGRELGEESLDAYLQTKTVWVNLD